MMGYIDDGDSDFDEDDNRSWRDDEGFGFADPGGRSALRAASKKNPRNLPCPTCHRKNMLTARDRQLHYQCDICADAAEGGYDSY